jgi:hypothetical protein
MTTEQFVAVLEARGARFVWLLEKLDEFVLNTDGIDDLDEAEEIAIRHVMCDVYDEVRELLLARETKH